MSLKNDILSELFKSNDYISGEFIAEKYDKSRAAVWKAVKSLTKEGYSIDAVTNKGYKLFEDKNITSAQSIKSKMKTSADVLYYPSVDSTNNECKRLLAQGKQGVFLVVSDCQTAGRGRQGKAFVSPANTGIYFSLVIRPNTSFKNAVTATTAASVAVCMAVEELTDKKPVIKWVNDVYLDGRKICGILTEAITNFEDGTVESVIVGIGINLKKGAFPKELKDIVGFLDADINKNLLVARVIDNLVKINTGDYKTFIDYYRTHSMVIGQKIRIIKGDEQIEATALAIDQQGGLEVQLENGEKTVLRSGEISIRKI